MSAHPVVVHKEVELPHAPERVWAALTDPQALAHWLMPNTFRAIKGHAFTFSYDVMPMMPGNVIECVVLELDAPRRMVWSWRMVPLPGKRRFPAQEIEWRLEAIPSGTRLTLEQRRVGSEPPPNFVFRLMMAHGWKTMIRRWLPMVVEAMEPSADGYMYRVLAKRPNAGHHGTKTLGPEYFK